MLQVLVDGTSVASTVHTCASFPVAASDPVTRGMRTANPDVTLVDIPADNPRVALRAIELLHRELPEAAIFAIGNLNKPQIIVNAMRAGAREFIERPTNTPGLLAAFVRLITAQRLGRQEASAAKSSWSSMRRAATARRQWRSIWRWLSNLSTDKLR